MVRTADPTCCGCTKKPKNLRKLREGVASVEIEGKKYGRYAHFTAQCEDCGKTLFVKRFWTAVD